LSTVSEVFRDEIVYGPYEYLEQSGYWSILLG